ETALVVVRLRDDRHDARHADAVGAHCHRDELAVLVEHLEAEHLGILAAELEHVADLHATSDLVRPRTIRSGVSRAHVRHLDDSVRLEIATGDEPEGVPAMLVGTGDPPRALGHPGVAEIPDAGCRTVAEHRTGRTPRTDVALDEAGMLREVGVASSLDLTGSEGDLGALQVDLTVARETHDDDLAGAVECGDGEDDVLERVCGRPGATVRARMLLVRHRHERLDRGRVWGVEHLDGRELLEGTGGRRLRAEGLDVCGVSTGGAHEAVFADGGRVQELLAARSAHRTGVRLNNRVLEAESLEASLVGVALRLVA